MNEVKNFLFINCKIREYIQVIHYLWNNNFFLIVWTNDKVIDIEIFLHMLSTCIKHANHKLNLWHAHSQAFAYVFFIRSINNEIYLYEMLTTNLLQAMLVRRAEQSHQHQQSSNSALLTYWAHTQSKSETITTRSLTRWSLHTHRRTAMSLHTCCNSYTTYTHILQRHDSVFAHIQTDVMQ